MYQLQIILIKHPKCEPRGQSNDARWNQKKKIQSTPGSFVIWCNTNSVDKQLQINSDLWNGEIYKSSPHAKLQFWIKQKKSNDSGSEMIRYINYEQF